MPTFPPLVYGKSTNWIEIHGKPEIEIVITPQALNGDIVFTPKRIQIRFVFIKFYSTNFTTKNTQNITTRRTTKQYNTIKNNTS